MGFYETEVESVEIELNLESPDFEGVVIDYYNFTKIVEPGQNGGLPLDDFGSGFEIRKGGVYLKIPGEGVLAALTTQERAVLLQHPKGRPDMPVLAFPFTLKELKVFLDWAANVGHDVPINEDALIEIIEVQKIQRTLDTSSYSTIVNQSDASLAAHCRQLKRDFATKNQEYREARAVEHQRWRDAAEEIKGRRQRKVSERDLAKLVKEHLNLPDAESTIRARLSQPNLARK